jgi:hypothetical protein
MTDHRPKIYPTLSSNKLQSTSLSHSQSSVSFDTHKLKKLAESIKVEEDDEKLSIEQIRLSVKDFFTHTWLGECYNNILLVISVFSCFQYLQQTYEDNPNERDYIELSIAIIFTLDWCLSCFIADHKVIFFTR